ncbi:receptor activity-modifying protein 3-like isoform X1 [Alosa alosa]|uniref:receptor activity-modifying protein 3-like isoform X1 n=2 Tax=Alosa sapidissima TaxID=34773 RepID=UPI001C099787|nr:receptor activity-modifying protein 3-like isoform X1 [Alosa sapidissima]XP_048122469.1 receptor activity-modifying protein 3-like isoform X1 [Alosa alosa]
MQPGTRFSFIMDRNALTACKVFVMGILVNSLMSSALSETESSELGLTRRPLVLCNETQLLLEMDVCGEVFKRQMAHVDAQHWCNLTHFLSEYHLFSSCTEKNSERIGCYWPNPVVEGFIIQIHKLFFSNCTVERVVWVDPSDDLLAALILVPILLTLAMIALVVWCSKRSDILA